MKIPKEVLAYLNYELSSYKKYRKEIEAERARIIASSPPPQAGMPRAKKGGDQTAKLALRLCTAASILAMERVVNAVERTLAMLREEHARLFEELYIKGRRDYPSIYMELCIGERTFYKYKREIILIFGSELGLINLAK